MWIGIASVAGAGAVVLFSSFEGTRDEGGALPSGFAETAPPSSLPPWTAPVPTEDAAVEDEDPASFDGTEFFGVTGAQLDTSEFDITLYVDPASGSDQNPGTTPEERLASVTSALRIASDLRASGQGVRILLAPGTYRETIRSGGDADDAPLLVIAAETPGSAIITGADSWTDWTWDSDAEAFVHAWPFNWDVAPDVEEIVGRRELIEVDDELLMQVLEFGDLTDAAFFVDEEEERLYMRPPAGSSFPSLAAEVAVRPLLLEFDSVRNALVSGLVFTHAANSLDATAVRITNSDNVIFDRNDVVDNNWTGFGLSTSENITISNNTINHNGGGGAGIFRPYNVLFTGNDTSYNNWRGLRGDYLGWSIAGVKSVRASHTAFHRHRAWGNHTRGLWLDYDISNVAVLDSSWCHNLTDGLFLEATQGPVVVKNVESCNNARYGMLLVNLYEASIEDALICGNSVAQIHMDAEPGGREVETDEGVLTLSAALDLTFRSNVVSGKGPLLRVSISDKDFDLLRPTLDSDENAWYGDTPEDAFDLPSGLGGLEDWRTYSGHDLVSTWTASVAADCSVRR